MDEIGFHRLARDLPDATAVIDPSGKIWTRGHIAARSNALARALRIAGLGAGDVIAILSPNCVEYLEVYLAATQIGAYLVCINWHLAPAEIAYVLGDSGAKVCVVHQRLAELLERVLAANESRHPALTVLSIGHLRDFPSIESLCSSQSPAPLTDPAPGRTLTYTSATTGRPKAVDLPRADAGAALERMVHAFISCGVPPGEGNVHLCASMLYHAGPLDMATLALHMGHILRLVDRWDPEKLLQLIQVDRVTTTLMVPSMFVRMLKLPPPVRSKYDCRSLRFVGHSSAPCPPEIKRAMIEWWGPILWESYGSSEGGGTIVNSRDWLRYPGTVGRAFPGSRVKILDESGAEAPAGTVGTIYMTRFTGDRFAYRGDAAKTQAAYRGEYFTVGDLGYMNEEGYLFLCDRKVDLIISGGMNIYPAEVERVLLLHPEVVDCAVFGIPDDLTGEAVHAVIQLRDEVQGDLVLSQQITNFLCSRIGLAKIPRKLQFVSELPRDPNGKIHKRRLREALLQSRTMTTPP